MNVAAAIAAAADRLKRSRIDQPRLEAESLLARLLGKDLSWLLAHADADVPPRTAKDYAALVAKRARHVPFAYLTGTRGFYGREFLVTPATLVPRPETETLVEALLAHLPAGAGATILDIGTGSGAIGLTLAAERPGSRAVLYDLSKKALGVARRNARRLRLGRRVRLARYDVLRQALPEPKGGPVAIAANLPYLPLAAWKRAQPEVRAYEPRLALVSGTDGLRHYRALFGRLRRWKRVPELLAIEAEPGQMDDLRRLALEAMPAARIEILKDLHGDERVLLAHEKSPREEAVRDDGR